MTDHFTPTTIAQAVGLLSQYGKKARIVAGGTDLVVQMKRNRVVPEHIIDIKGIRELNFISAMESDGLRIGASTTISDLCNSSVIGHEFKVLAQALGMLGTPTIRRQATIGGNICNAAPSADVAPPLMVLDAKVKISGNNEERMVPIDEFFVGPGQTCLQADELAVELDLPPLPSHSGAVYLKQKRSQGADIAIAGAAVLVSLEKNTLREVRIALGAVAPTPIRAYRTEEYLKGKTFDNKLLEEGAKMAVNEIKPIDDVRSSAVYRSRVVQVLVRRALQEAIEQAKQEDK